MRLRRKKQKGIPKILAILLVLLVLGAIGTIAFFICRVHDIRVDGTTRYTRDEIISMSGLQLDESMFVMNESAIASALQKDPYIKSVKIERQFPETVNITIVERVPAAMIQYLNSFFKMDPDGYILEITDNAANESCPVLSGMNVSTFQIGQEIKSQDSKQVDAYKAIMNKLSSSNLSSGISEINIANLVNIYLISREGIKIRLGSISDLDKKILWIKNVLSYLLKQGKNGGTIDATNPESPSYIPSNVNE